MIRSTIPTRIIPPYIPDNDLKHNVTNRDPTVNDDLTEGYAPLSRWVNQSNQTHWVLLDNSEGAALWVETTAGAGLGTGFEGTWKVVEIVSADFTYTTASIYNLPTTPTTDTDLIPAFELFRNGIADQTRVTTTPSQANEYQVSGSQLVVFGDITTDLDTYKFRYIS
jgi:hypothetical protein